MLSSLRRVSRSDDAPSYPFILLHVTGSTDPLHLTLRATDAADPFELDVSSKSQLAGFKTPQCSYSDDDFEAILWHLLLRSPVDDPSLVRGVELSASVEAGHVTLAIRKDIGGIKQRLAEFEIPQNDEAECDIFQWAAESSIAIDNASGELRSKQSEAENQGKTVEKLLHQLESLAQLKKEHEETLLIKFKELLNSKKAKIRELNRDLEAARAGGVDGRGKEKVPEDDTPEPEAPPKTRGRKKAAPNPKPTPKPAARATRKRKPVEPPPESDSDTMNIDEPPKRATRSKGKAVAQPSPPPDIDEDATASEEESDAKVTDRESEDDVPPPPRKPFGFAKKPPAQASGDENQSSTTMEGNEGGGLQASADTPESETLAILNEGSSGEMDDDEL